MRLGLALGAPACSARRARAGQASPRRPSGWGSRPLGPPKPTAATPRPRWLDRGTHLTDRPWRGGAADPRAHARDDGHDGRDPRHPVRRPVPPWPGRVGSRGLRGLARVAVQAALARTREYVEIVRTALRGERVDYQGAQFSVPLAGTGHRPLRLSVRPPREVPIYLAAVGPEGHRAGRGDRRRLAGRLLLPGALGRAGRRDPVGPRGGRVLGRFEVIATVPLSVGDDPVAAADICVTTSRSTSAAWAPGSGISTTCSRARSATSSRPRSFRNAILGRDRAGAAQAVPFGLIDETALVGPKEHLAERLRCYADAGVDTVTVWPVGQAPDEAIASLRVAAAALDLAGVDRAGRSLLAAGRAIRSPPASCRRPGCRSGRPAGRPTPGRPGRRRARPPGSSGRS